MSNIKYPYTVEELYNNYEFKVVKRAIMREFPWIENVTVDPEQLKKYNTIFLNFDVNPVKLGDEMGWTITPWVKDAYEQGKEYKGIYLSLLFDKVDYDETRDIAQSIETLARSVHNSPALPHDLKLKGDRRFSIGDFYVNQGKQPW